MYKSTLAMVLFGESGSGKSTTAGTGPKPYLVFDIESGTRYVRAFRRKVYWNPLEELSPPEYIVDPTTGESNFDAVVVNVLEWGSLYLGYQYLNDNVHPFKTVIVDSLTEAQKRLVDAVSGTEAPTLNQWGTIGRNLEDIIRKLRDLTFHPTNPVEAVVFTALAHVANGTTKPYLKGAVEMTLPALVDVVSYLYVENVSGEQHHRSLIVPANGIVAKDRTGALKDHYGPVISEANISEWLEVLNEEFGNTEV